MTKLGEPTYETLSSGYRFRYETEGIDAIVRGVSKDRLGNLIAEVDFVSDCRDDFKELLGTRINLYSLSSRKKAADELTKSKIYNENHDNGNGISFHEIFEDLANRLIKLHRDGNAPVEIWPSEDVNLKTEYLIEPILYLNHPTVIFGDYGSAKSFFALVTVAVCQLPYYNNLLGLTAPKEPSPCLYLDYEDDKKNFEKRWTALLRGFDVGEMPILYEKMTNPLWDVTDQVQKWVADNNIKLLIIDSLGLAAGGNLNDAEPAIKYHRAIRQLGITSLTLAHCSKDQLTKKKTIFGSVFFTNLARSVWECKAEQETGENKTVISLKHTKANLSQLHPPLGYKFTFSDSEIKVCKADLSVTGLSGELPLPTRIKLLLNKGKLPTKTIAEELDANEGSIKTILNRRKDLFVKVGDNWGNKSNE